MSSPQNTKEVPPGLRLRHVFKGQGGAINRIAWSPDGNLLAVASSDRALRLWDPASGKFLQILGRSSAAIESLAWSPDARVLASGGKDGKVDLWGLDTGRQRTVSLPSEVTALSWSPDGASIAAGSTDLRIWQLKEEDPSLQKLGRSGFKISSLAWSPDGKLLACASLGIQLWDTADWKPAQDFPGVTYTLSWAHKGSLLAFGSEAIRVWDVATGQPVRTLVGHTNFVKCVAFSAHDRLLASKSVDGTVRLWDCKTWETVAVLTEPATKDSPGLDFHPREPVLATLGEDDKAVRIWDIDYTALLGTPPAEEAVHYTTAKIVLVGDSGVGKTALGWRLAHDEFKAQESTHGEQFWVIGELGTRRQDGTHCEAVLWDFAGQPDYRIVHSLFLDDVDLALLVFDSSNREAPLSGVEYWLQQLSRAGTPPPAILVGARCDRGTPSLTPGELEAFCDNEGITGGYIATSAYSGAGIPELMKRVRNRVPWSALPSTDTTLTFKRIKDAVLALKEGASERKDLLVSPEALLRRLHNLDPALAFDREEMMAAVRNLSNHGYLTTLKASSGETSILLSPNLLTNLASSFVLEARRNPRGLGALDEQVVLRGGYSFPDLSGLAPGKREVLRAAATTLFLEHNLCFRETLAQQTLLVFPSLINQKRPMIEEIETIDDVSYHVVGPVENVYASLVVRLGYTNTFTRTHQWQNQAQYETDSGDVCGFRQIADREGEIELVLYHGTRMSGSRLLFQGLFEQFLSGRDVTVTKYLPVVCPKCKYQQPRSEVIKRVRDKTGFLFCGNCGKKIVLPKEGEKVALSRADRERLVQEHSISGARTAYEAALVAVKGLAGSRRTDAPSCFISYAWGDPGQERWVTGLAADLENAGIRAVLDRRDNAEPGRNVARFVSRIAESDFVVAVGTPLYLEKYVNRLKPTGSILAAEADLIQQRLLGTEEEKDTVLPLLLAGDERTSLPALMRGRVHADFRREEQYFAGLFDLALTLFRIPFRHPGVADLREAMRGSVLPVQTG